MHKTMEEALEKYKKTFQSFKNWLEPIMKYLAEKDKGTKITTTVLMSKMSNSDWEKYNDFLAKLGAMEEALGISQEECDKISQEVGYTDLWKKYK